jgi:major membrane immunogen (membrane-anchored lipoprotein)
MKIFKINNLILLVALVILGACNVSGAPTPTSSVNNGTNVLAYASAEDLGICSGLGFNTDEGLNSCVRSRMLTKSAMFKNQVGYNTNKQY